MSNTKIYVARHSAEMPLFILSLLLSLPIIALIIISVFGIIYSLIFLTIIFIGHIAAISYIRGSAVRVTPEQLPDVYQSVESISQRFGLKKVPEIYVMQGNGILNAMSTKFLFRRIFVIYSDLLDACENNPGAREMVIGHELGHIVAGHLRWSWLLWPSCIIPFLYNSLSRAREYTADRYGYACVENKKDALKGLLILAGGKHTANKISVEQFASQIKNLNTGFMRLGEWLHSHPTIVRRICALENNLYQKSYRSGSKTSVIKALILIALMIGMTISTVIIIGTASVAAIEKEKNMRSELTD